MEIICLSTLHYVHKTRVLSSLTEASTVSLATAVPTSFMFGARHDPILFHLFRFFFSLNDILVERFPTSQWEDPHPRILPCGATSGLSEAEDRARIRPVTPSPPVFSGHQPSPSFGSGTGVSWDSGSLFLTKVCKGKESVLA